MELFTNKETEAASANETERKSKLILLLKKTSFLKFSFLIVYIQTLLLLLLCALSFLLLFFFSSFPNVPFVGFCVLQLHRMLLCDSAKTWVICRQSILE